MTGSAPAPDAPDHANASSGETLVSARMLGRLFVAAVILGILARVLFVESKPFWRDEAWVAMLVDDPIRTIRDGRATPIGFLWLVHTAREWLPGPPELTYRFVPLVVGIAIVPLFARMARGFGALREVGVMAVWLAAGLPPFIYYSRELKSYDLDMALTMILPMLAIAGFEAAEPKRGARLALAVLVAVAPWVSFASIFPISALLAWGWLVWFRRSSFELRRDLFLCSVAFTASFVAAYFIALAPQSSSPRLLGYWRPHLLAKLSLWTSFTKGVTDFVTVSNAYFFGQWWRPVVAVALVGALTWPRRSRAFLAWMYGGTALFCIAASMMDRYVIGHGRLVMFALPPITLWLAQGIWTLTRPVGPRRHAAVALAIPIAVGLFFSVKSIEWRVGQYSTNRSEFFRYDVLQDVDDAIAATVPLVEPGDSVIVSLRTGYAFQFYRKGRLPQAKYCERACPSWEPIAAGWLENIHGQCWLILADEEIFQMRKYLDDLAVPYKQTEQVRGARVWKLDRTGEMTPRSERGKKAEELEFGQPTAIRREPSKQRDKPARERATRKNGKQRDAGSRPPDEKSGDGKSKP